MAYCLQEVAEFNLPDKTTLEVEWTRLSNTNNINNTINTSNTNDTSIVSIASIAEKRKRETAPIQNDSVKTCFHCGLPAVEEFKEHYFCEEHYVRARELGLTIFMAQA